MRFKEESLHFAGKLVLNYAKFQESIPRTKCDLTLSWRQWSVEKWRLWSPPSLLLSWYRSSGPGVKQLGREVDHSPLSSSKLKNAWSDTSSPPKCLHGADKDRFSFYFFTVLGLLFIPAMQCPSGNIKVQVQNSSCLNTSPLLHTAKHPLPNGLPCFQPIFVRRTRGDRLGTFRTAKTFYPVIEVRLAHSPIQLISQK
jgi:hypothetical protein